MASPTLGLDAAPTRQAYREVVRILQADAVLSRVVRTWFTWEGKVAHDQLEVVSTMCPAVSLTPVEGADEWDGPQGFITPLSIRCNVAVKGTDADDLLDLYYAVRRAIYPADDTARQAIQQALHAAKVRAEYLIRFPAPSFGLASDEQGGIMLLGFGLIVLPVEEILNP